MKTLHLTNCWHPESGGISTFYRELLRQAENERRQIRLVVPGEADGVERHGKYGLIYRVHGRPSKLSPGYRMIMPASYLLPGGRVRKILAAERPEVVECCDKYTLNYLGGLLRVGRLGIRGYRPAVIGITCERMDENMARYISTSELSRRFCRWYMRWLYFPLCDHHIAVSPHTAAELQEASFPHRVRRGVWIRPMGADCRLFTPDRRSQTFRRWLESLSGAPEGSTLLLYTGRLAPEKNLDLLIQTMRLLEHRRGGEFHLLIAGDGLLRRELEGVCERDLPGAVYFLGYVQSRDMLADIYANCDVLLHPNPREPFGIAPLEAMAAGLPIVGPNTGGITSYANASNALLVDAMPDSFAEAAVLLREDRNLAAAHRHAGRRTAREFDWPLVCSSFFTLYEELYALTQGQRKEPAMAPEFYSSYSTLRRPFGWQL
ncbi:MAG TPA: glycosyltransferase [Candidatus Solibacter sp.]|nr:glycosyltransferase [Candidatus Solibacter sp.]